ncbi:MAG: phosphate ABC transporter permease subunit PstC, partial [Rhodococcus sp. (in: high G+C Gram-positive bacteria)]
MSDAPTKTARTESEDPARSGTGGHPGTTEATIITTPPWERTHKTVVRPGDRIFGSLATGSAILISVIIGAIAV